MIFDFLEHLVRYIHVNMSDYSRRGIVHGNTLITCRWGGGGECYLDTQMFDCELEYICSKLKFWSLSAKHQNDKWAVMGKNKSVNSPFTGKETDGNCSWRDLAKLLIHGNSTINIIKVLIINYSIGDREFKDRSF